MTHLFRKKICEIKSQRNLILVHLFLFKMKHQFHLLETVDGLIYTTISECHVQGVLDFYFNHFLPGDKF